MSLTGDDEESSDFRNISENNLQRIENKISNVGYADGITDGRESVFQDAFDVGYGDGLRTAFDIEKFRHFLKNIDEAKCDKTMCTEKLKYLELDVPDAKSPSHFRYLECKEKELNFVSKEQLKYVDGIMDRCSKNLPNSSKLLSLEK